MPCLRPSAVRARLQPAAELGHLPSHNHGEHVSGALLPTHTAPRYAVAALSPARCVHATCTPRARPPPPASRPAARPAPYTPCACDPRQNALVFNQPLSWDISRVTDMRWMFTVPCSPRPVPPNLQSLALLPARCVHRAIAPRVHPRAAARASPLKIPRTPSLRLGRAKTPCPPRTSCSSAARGRATPPSATSSEP